MAFPDHVRDISAPWLASVFGFEPEQIGSIKLEPMGEGVGFTSEVCFVSVDGPADDQMPGRIVAKQCTDYPAAAKMSVDLQLFEREARFYAEIAPTLAVRTPRCYFADFNPAIQRGLILLEDCSHYSVRSQIEDVPTTLEELGALIDVLASMNRVADDPSLASKSWLFKPGNRGFDRFFRMIGENWSTFMASPVRDFLPREFEPMYERLAPLYTDTVFQHYPKDGLGLSHFDFRIDNVFFDESGADPIVVYDWQAVGLARGPMDLAYLLGASYSADFRRKHERWALEHYCAALEERGRNDYSLEDAQRDYRFGAFMIQWLMPQVATNLDVSSDRAKELVAKVFPAAAAILQDQGGLDLIDELASRSA